ncbi:Mur ligase [Aspergillus crustosus]
MRAIRGIGGMTEWLQMLGYSVEDLNALNAIHVAGSDGKGSTCAFISSMLTSSGKKVGLYTTPHIKDTRE